MKNEKEIAEVLINYKKEKDSCKYKAANPEICVLLGSMIWHNCRLKTKKETEKCPLRQMEELG